MNLLPYGSARLLIAAAAILHLSSIARAEGDAAFASALGRIEGPRAVMTQLKDRSRELRAPKAPAAPEAVWEKVLETVRLHGNYKPGNGMLPETFSLEDSTGDPKGEHSVNAITVAGMLDDEERFVAMGVMLSFEDHKLDARDGNRHIEKWVIQTDVYGRIANAGHGVVVQTPAGERVSSTPDKVSPSDPRLKARFEAMLEHWANRTPEGAQP